MTDKSLFKILTAFLCALLIIAAFLPFLKTNAQTTQKPQLIVTWQAQNYQPADYSGKNLPTLNSPIIAVIELIDNGKLVNISEATIIWFQNNDFIVSGAGLKRIAFNSNGLIGDRFLLEADISFEENKTYKDSATFKKYKGKELRGAAIIPVVEPKAVIAAPHIFNQEIKTGKHSFKIMPFFFNIKNLEELLFTWSVNEQQEIPTINPDVLNLEINSEEINPVPLNLTATVANVNNILEAAKDELRLMLIP